MIKLGQIIQLKRLQLQYWCTWFECI